MTCPAGIRIRSLAACQAKHGESSLRTETVGLALRDGAYPDLDAHIGRIIQEASSA